MGKIDDIDNIQNFNVTAVMLADLLKLIDNDTISGKIAKTVFDEMIKTKKAPMTIIDEKGLKQVTDSGEIEGMVDTVLSNNPQSIQDFKDGKQKAIGFLVGQVMKASAGKANPQIVNELLRKKLSE